MADRTLPPIPTPHGNSHGVHLCHIHQNALFYADGFSARRVLRFAQPLETQSTTKFCAKDWAGRSCRCFLAQIVIGSTASFLGVPHAPPAENLTSHVGVELPLFLFLFFVHAGSVELAADIVGWVHVGPVEGVANLVVPILGHMERGLYCADELLLLTKVTSCCHFYTPFFP